MKKLLLVANWKANKTESEANDWLKRFKSDDVGFKNNEKEIIICSPFTLLPILKSYFLSHNSQIKLGAQDVSPFPRGAYTGEVAADQLKEFVSSVLIGHSERRKYFHENDQMLANKVDLAITSGLTPIFCVQDEHTSIPKGVKIVAYEPVFAIGTGEPDSPRNAEEVARQLTENSQVSMVLYGGSVTDKNVHAFTSMEHISGVLVGSASLDPSSFMSIIANA